MEEKKITSMLLRLGLSPDLSGFRYLADAIRIWAAAEPEKPSFTKEIYPSVAEKYGTQTKRVDRNIRHAIDTLGIRVPLERTAEILGVDIDAYPDGFTNSQFIALCALKIKGGENNG